MNLSFHQKLVWWKSVEACGLQGILKHPGSPKVCVLGGSFLYQLRGCDQLFCYLTDLNQTRHTYTMSQSDQNTYWNFFSGPKNWPQKFQKYFFRDHTSEAVCLKQIRHFITDMSVNLSFHQKLVWWKSVNPCGLQGVLKCLGPPKGVYYRGSIFDQVRGCDQLFWYSADSNQTLHTCTRSQGDQNTYENFFSFAKIWP